MLLIFISFYLSLVFNDEQCAGKYTVMADYENGAAEELLMKSGDMVQLVKEGDDGQWWEHTITSLCVR